MEDMENGSVSNGAAADVSSLSLTEKGKSELIVLGSGSSTGVPSPMCLMQPTEPPCFVCHSAMEGRPELNKNYRFGFFPLVDNSNLQCGKICQDWFERRFLLNFGAAVVLFSDLVFGGQD